MMATRTFLLLAVTFVDRFARWFVVMSAPSSAYGDAPLWRRGPAAGYAPGRRRPSGSATAKTTHGSDATARDSRNRTPGDPCAGCVPVPDGAGRANATRRAAGSCSAAQPTRRRSIRPVLAPVARRCAGARRWSACGDRGPGRGRVKSYKRRLIHYRRRPWGSKTGLQVAGQPHDGLGTEEVLVARANELLH